MWSMTGHIKSVAILQQRTQSSVAHIVDSSVSNCQTIIRVISLGEDIILTFCQDGKTIFALYSSYIYGFLWSCMKLLYYNKGDEVTNE